MKVAFVRSRFVFKKLEVCVFKSDKSLPPTGCHNQRSKDNTQTIYLFSLSSVLVNKF